MSDRPQVLLERRGRLGSITLNRPEVINALNHGMVRAIQSALHTWADDRAVRAVIIAGVGDRGMCAGGDIAALYRDAIAGGAAAEAFWRDEYALNATIARYPKPIVAVMDGLVLGGGVGLGAHASHRIVTESSQVGFPETGIGFVPDVGGTYLLSRAPGELGTHLALTASLAGPGDTIQSGLADSFVPRRRLPELVGDLELEEPQKAISRHEESAPTAVLIGQRSWIDRVYGAPDLEDIVARLSAEDGAGPLAAARAIAAKSPIALAVTFASLRRTEQLDTLEDVLNQEFRVSTRAISSLDMLEGIRAQVIDKDRRPRWRPAAIEDVTTEMVDSYFAPVPHELGLIRSDTHT